MLGCYLDDGLFKFGWSGLCVRSRGTDVTLLLSFGTHKEG